MYADDHQMYATGRPTGKKHDVVAQSIKTQNESKFHIILVQLNNFLSAKPVKFQQLTINPRNVDTENNNQDISVDGHAIERKGEIKPLGVQID